MKKFTAFMAVTCIIFVVNGCSNKMDDNQIKADNQVSASIPAASGALPSPESNKPILITTEDYEGVILTDSEDDKWIPSKEEIDEFEDNLKQYLNNPPKSVGKQYSKSIPYMIEHIKRYKRQYAGTIESNGEKIITCNFVTVYTDEADDWKYKKMLVFDGGADFFEIEYEVKTKKFSKLYVHGYA